MNLLKLMILIPIIVAILSLYLSFIGETRAKLNVLFGVSMPINQLKDESVLNIIETYAKSMNVMMLIALFTQVILFIVIENVFLMTMLSIVVAVLCIYSMSRPFAKAHKELKLLKIEKEWNISVEDVVLMDTKVSRIKHTFVISPMYILVPIFMSVLIFLGDDVMFQTKLFIFSIGTLINGMIILFFYINKKSRTKAFSNNSDVNLAINKKLIESNSIILFLFALINNFLCILISFYFLHGTFLFVMGITLTLMYLVIVLLIERKNRVYTSFILSNDEQVIEMNDDKYWKHGTFYNNPHDNALFVHKRNGVGYTINMGTKKGKIVFTLVCTSIAASIILTCYFIILAI